VYRINYWKGNQITGRKFLAAPRLGSRGQFVIDESISIEKMAKEIRQSPGQSLGPVVYNGENHFERSFVLPQQNDTIEVLYAPSYNRGRKEWEQVSVTRIWVPPLRGDTRVWRSVGAIICSWEYAKSDLAEKDIELKAGNWRWPTDTEDGGNEGTNEGGNKGGDEGGDDGAIGGVEGCDDGGNTGDTVDKGGANGGNDDGANRDDKERQGDIEGVRRARRSAQQPADDTEEEGPIYKAAEDRECGVTRRESGEAMTRVLQKLRRSRGVQVAYLQGGVGMKSEAAFTELIGFITDLPALWAVDLGEQVNWASNSAQRSVPSCLELLQCLRLYAHTTTRAPQGHICRATRGSSLPPRVSIAQSTSAGTAARAARGMQT
jgi:hypothetical protein